jgi:hypothetical protein
MFVTPAKAGVQFKVAEKEGFQTMMNSQKALWIVTPAKAGVQNLLKSLDSGFRRNDKIYWNSTFCEIINNNVQT